MSDIRLRFSPAPTGFLQLGNVRAALYNWLYARHTGGTFILRLEDTDVVRSTQESIDRIQSSLRWLGLEWDEGPYLQSHRFDAYLAAAQRLLVGGHAYECYCTEEEVKDRNEAAAREGRPPGYDGRCRTLTAEQRAAQAAEGWPRSIRFRTPDEGRSTFTDLIRGEVSVEWSTVSDFVIVRSNGTPVFFLANALDDIEMNISHVFRGEDLIDSTHRVLALRRALGHDDQPIYAHLPLILGPGGGKLSKRHGAASVEEYRDQGYLPTGLLNYLALLGWGPEDGREVLTTQELVGEFDIARVNPSGATFDPKKLEWMNGEHIRRLSVAELQSAVLPFARDRYGARLDIPRYEKAVALAQERATTLVQIADQMAFLFVEDDDLAIDDASWNKLLGVEMGPAILDAVIDLVASVEWSESIDVRPAIEALGLKAGKVMHVIYTSIEGRSAGLPLFPSIALLGRESALARLRAARARL
ncbi:MAG TPA: glutamate--tRNA ligase [Acidimicrobiia bacterium]|jgi:glutamyl-tRNA synthetase|nr:glutamate--tRNA ligase [Acidimicrobiia bacterium]